MKRKSKIHPLHRLVVVESESQRTRPVGILSLTDLTRAGVNGVQMEAK